VRLVEQRRDGAIAFTTRSIASASTPDPWPPTLLLSPSRNFSKADSASSSTIERFDFSSVDTWSTVIHHQGSLSLARPQNNGPALTLCGCTSSNGFLEKRKQITHDKG
jgi:hypothetical protein